VATSDTPEQANPTPTKSVPQYAAEIPQRILRTYSRLWQLETWLRRLVYLELHSFQGDNWSKLVHVSDVPLDMDKRLKHMPTPESDPLSYVEFSELRRIIREHWPLFEPYLPPKKLWEAKLEEVEQIRHRVAHFRIGHEDDLARVIQLLRDIDNGFWRFCTSYNQSHSVLPQSDDPVVQHFLPLDPLPWREVKDNQWARVGSIDQREYFGMTVEAICRLWATWSVPVAGKEGLLYDVVLYVRGAHYLDCGTLLEQTQSLHKHLVYICLDPHATDIRVTIPAILGADRVIQILENFIAISRSCICPGSWPSYKGTVQDLADAWPEYVLGSDNPLSYLAPDMPCSFFSV